MTDTPKPKRGRRFARTPNTELQPDGEATCPQVDTLAPPPLAEPPTKPESKAARIVAMMQRKEGATLEEMVATTGWLPHTTRAAMTGLKRKGHTITSVKTDSVRRYHASVTQ